MESESVTPADTTVDKHSSTSPSKSPSQAPPAPAAAALSDTSDSESDDASPQVEWLATARERRSTAGNRMKSMLAAEEPDDDLELLFAEDDNDQGFSDGGDDGSDVHMDSSSDEEDNHNATGADDLEGEKELERQAKEKRAAQRKRKAQDAHIPAKFRKKVRINTEAPPPRPKKKSERASWLPSPADLPTRASSRSTTRMSKEQLHTQMVEREARRLKQVAQMQKKAAKLEAMRKPPMTQEERLREAEKVEQRNRGSLNRWEEAEKAREEERLRKLKALTERRLEGPVITFWSGVREGQVRYVEMEEKPVRKKREKPAKGKAGEKKEGEDGETPKPEGTAEAEKAEGKKSEAGKDVPTAPDVASELQIEDGTQPESTKEGQESKPPVSGSVEAAKADEGQGSKNVSRATSPAPPGQNVKSPKEPGIATGDEEPSPKPELEKEKEETTAAEQRKPVSSETDDSVQCQEPEKKSSSATSAPLTQPANAQPPDTATPTSPNPNPSSVLAAPSTVSTSANELHDPLSSSSLAASGPNLTSQPKPPMDKDSVPESVDISPTAPQSEQPTSNVEPTDETQAAASTATPAATERAPRNAIIFQNFNENVIKDKSIQTQILFGQKMARLSKPAPNPVCVITNRPARYLDPSTGLPFATAHAYHEIRRLIRGDYKWSRLLGAWVGTGTYAARGVPERFLNPKAEGPKEKKRREEEERKMKEEEERKIKEEEAGKRKEEEDKKEKGEEGGQKTEAPEGAAGGADVAMAEAPAVNA